jgi:hypothetical protein
MDNFESRAHSRRACAYRFELFARLLQDEGVSKL